MKAQLSVALLSGFIGAKLNFMFENFPLRTIITIFFSPIKVKMGLKITGFNGV